MISKRFSKGGSSAFLKTLKSGRQTERRSAMSDLVAIMSALERGPMTIEALAMRFPSAERIVHSLVVDGMVERTTTSEGEAVELSPQGREFIKRRGTF